MELRRHGLDPAVPVAHKMHEIMTNKIPGLPLALRTLSLQEASAVVVQWKSASLFSLRC
jgi:hypothetical protein